MRFLLFLFCMICGSLPALSQQLSPYSEISLLTVGPGKQLYSTFGHTAIRVHDPATNINRVYGYGTFDFDTPFFYLKFARGKLNYKLDIDPFRTSPRRPGFMAIYRFLDRTVDEQVLNLTQAHKQAIFDFLETNYLPENRYYLYDFFFDNCATRPRDVFIQVLGDQLIFHHDYLNTEHTFRELIDMYLQVKPWADFGIDLALGAVIDRPVQPMEYMFLPDYLARAFDHATVVIEGKEVPFVKSKRRLYQSRRKFEPVPLTQKPVFIFSVLALLLLGVSAWEWKKGRIIPWIDALLFGLAGLGGLVIFFLMFLTDHTATAQNMNILWLLPTHLLLPFVLFRSSKPRWFRPYLWLSGAMLLLLLLGWPILPQELHPASIPLMLMLLMRLVLYLFGPGRG